jgi:hypothetical protein
LQAKTPFFKPEEWGYTLSLLNKGKNYFKNSRLRPRARRKQIQKWSPPAAD